MSCQFLRSIYDANKRNYNNLLFYPIRSSFVIYAETLVNGLFLSTLKHNNNYKTFYYSYIHIIPMALVIFFIKKKL